MASDLLTTCFAASHAELRSLRVTGEVFFTVRRIGPKLEKARRVLQFGSWTGFVQRGDCIERVCHQRFYLIQYPKMHTLFG